MLGKITKLHKGFTLIELIIVIAVLGILAVAVLSAINPIEQINRSKDTGGRSDAEQLLSAIDRYYASKGVYPWQATSSSSEATGWIKVDNAWTDGANPVLTKLSETGTAELKASFTNRIIGSSYNYLYAYNRGTSGDSVYLCFSPKSSSFGTEAGDRCATILPADFPSSACSSNCATEKTCYICLP